MSSILGLLRSLAFNISVVVLQCPPDIAIYIVGRYSDKLYSDWDENGTEISDALPSLRLGSSSSVLTAGFYLSSTLISREYME